MPFTYYVDNALIQLLFNGTTFTALSNVYIGLSTTTPSQTKGSTTPYWNFTEPSGNAYARVQVGATTANFPAPTTGSTSNNVTISFPQATGSWGTVTYFGIFDASTGGNLLGYGALNTSQTIISGNVLTFSANQITLSNN
ncbi:hypothetical protein DEAC_c23630 [Desulfosporosinus acididurans]|uniref:Uncharacterized protein n=1 Tax=Desulfosporosinus acididurans TaxID=476652 RepID=A0A0J1FRV7_9FIRM|nr:hypothetical protein [Desulfosporosinus acididurans]KLU65733.1 hypothetical protein DEAC_c23630 [Desulfosporosinus acididurans]